MNIAVLASGSGTNLQALIDKLHLNKDVNIDITVVISDNKEAYALERAKKAGVPTIYVELKNFLNREAFDEEIMSLLEEYEVELVVLAGYMKVLTSKFVQQYRNRILNIHPALLPLFPGTHGVRDTLEYGVKVSGVTIHFVDEGVDTGPIIAQAAVPVYDDDDEESLHARIHVEEHRLYPEVVKMYADGRLKVVGRKVYIK